LLSHFEIIPSVIRLPDGRTLRGYFKNDFAESWERYLPSEFVTLPDTPISKRNNVTNSINTGESASFDGVTERTPYIGENGETTNKNAPCDVVTSSKPTRAQVATEEDL